jgi:hypothetical protein
VKSSAGIVRAFALSFTLLVAGATLAQAQTVVTTGAPAGWIFGDGGVGTDPAQITGTQPLSGNGSLQFTVTAGNQQPAAAFIFNTPVALSSLSSLSLGFSWLVPSGTVPASSPTIRLLLSNLTDAGQSGRSDGSLGWYNNGTNDSWDSGLFSLTSGDFFFRVGGVGQESDACNSAGSTFDDRRQTIASWDADCTGAGGTADLATAMVTGIEVDWGTFPGNTATSSSFADLVNFSVGGNSGDFNFEQVGGSTLAVTPEPATMSLMAFGLVGMAGAVTRRRKNSR